MIFKKKTINGMSQEKVITLIFTIGNKLIQDLGNENNLSKTLDEYGKEILNEFPDLLKLRKGGV